MALASQTSRMTSNRSYMMSNVSRRRRRVQRRNIAIAAVVVLLLIAGGWYMLMGGGDETNPAVDSPRAGASAATSPLGPSTASAAEQRAETPTTPVRAPETQRSAALPDPEPVLRSTQDTAAPSQTAQKPAEPDGAAVIEMGVPVVKNDPPPSTTAQQTGRPQQSSTSAALPATTSAGVSDLVGRADALVAQSRPLEARDILNRALFARSTTEAERDTIRARLTSINDTLVFSRAVAPGDPVASSYTIGPGDSLAKIAASENTRTDWRLISQVNGISDPRRIRVGQSIKLVKGPFHAVVYKSRFRLDLYANATDSAGNRLYIRSFPVGLGEFGSTPAGSFVVRSNSKLINPVWTNPRTGEYFGADNPENPIGEHWIGLDPANEASAEYTQYGLHGTIDPQSIGQNKSMGCVRLAAPDIELLYGLLVEKDSTVEILP